MGRDAPSRTPMPTRRESVDTSVTDRCDGNYSIASRVVIRHPSSSRVARRAIHPFARFDRSRSSASRSIDRSAPSSFVSFVRFDPYRDEAHRFATRGGAFTGVLRRGAHRGGRALGATRARRRGDDRGGGGRREGEHLSPKSRRVTDARAGVVRVALGPPRPPIATRRCGTHRIHASDRAPQHQSPRDGVDVYVCMDASRIHGGLDRPCVRSTVDSRTRRSRSFARSRSRRGGDAGR